MFYVYHSNALDVLKALLTRIISQDPLSDPFESENILVQSPGMAQWLKLELAQAQGIAAAVDFPLPASYLWRNFADLLADVPERSAFDKEAMTWRLMAVLPRCLDDEAFAPLRGYLKDYLTAIRADQDAPLDYKCYQLCNRIADTFDQYLVYRPGWIDDWQQGGAINAETQPWQPILWRKLVAETEHLGLSHWHRGNMMSAFIARAQANPVSKRLFVFGISALPQHYLDALAAIAKHSDVHLFVTNPCQSYWGDIVDAKFLAKIDERWLAKLEQDGMLATDQTTPTDLYEIGNPLLASMGKLGRDYLVQLQSMPVREIDAFAEIERDSLLHHVQRDILDLANPKAALTPGIMQVDDESIRLHACHSPMRELEVLHDQLLALFDRQALNRQTLNSGSEDSHSEPLQPKDIIVMMSDVATYAPYIDAVFGQAQGTQYIPYSIADKSLEQESPILNSFMCLIQLSTSRLEVADVLELLEVPAILAKLGLDEASFKRIRHWVLDANIRWGLSGEQREQWDIPAFEQNSWLFGLKRMLAGYALGEQNEPWMGIAGFSHIEGLEANDLGALVRFVELLCDCCHDFSGHASLEQWQQRVLALIDTAYTAEPNDEFALEQVRKAMAQLQRVYGESGMDKPIPMDVLVDFIKSHISGESSGRGFMVGAVNFCTLMPMRSIPFKVVCLLGMNDGTYPRSMPPLGFDLIAEHPQRGDRSRRDDDRYLFLEAILSAQESLYISYLGRSVQDNSEKVASVLVSELTEYLDAGYTLEPSADEQHQGKKVSEWLTTEHALVPFNTGYFRSNSVADGQRLFSYAGDWLETLEAASNSGDVSEPDYAPLPAIELDNQLDVERLIRFFKAPIRQFFNQRLNVYFDDSLDGSVSLSEDQGEGAEPFDLDNLVKYHLGDRYLDTALHTLGGMDTTDLSFTDESDTNSLENLPSLDALDRFVAAEGLLPVSSVAGRRQQQVKGEMLAMAKSIRQAMQGPRTRQELSVPLCVHHLLEPQLPPQNIELVGWQDHWYGERLVIYRPAKAKGSDFFGAWLNHLAACASGLSITETLCFAKDKSFSFTPLDETYATHLLADLVSIYQYAMSWPLALEMNTAWTAWEAFDKTWQKQRDKASDEAGQNKAKWLAALDAIKVANKSIESSPYVNGLDADPYFNKSLEQGFFGSANVALGAVPNELSSSLPTSLPSLASIDIDDNSFGALLYPWINLLIVPMLPWLEIKADETGSENRQVKGKVKSEGAQ